MLSCTSWIDKKERKKRNKEKKWVKLKAFPTNVGRGIILKQTVTVIHYSSVADTVIFHNSYAFR